MFLSGQVNIAACPQCGYAGMLSTPLVYHDPEKELLFTFAPSAPGLLEAEQQRIIGDLTNRVISALPAEKRRGYLLRPRSFLQMEAMIEAILEADGITKEMLEAQRAKAALLDRLLRATSEEARRVIAQENDAQLDYQFLQLLTLNIELAQAEGQTEVVQQLLELREQLMDWTTTGQDVSAREEAIQSLGKEITREGLLEKLVEAALAGQQAKVETMIAVARPAIDYVFYQQLTERITAAEKADNTEETNTLKALRETILDLTGRIDARVRQETEQAAQFLQTVLESDDPEEVIRANLDQVNELFLGILGTNLELATQSGRTDMADKLQQIGDLLTQIMLEGQPPEIQFINRLLATEYPDGTRALLEENRQQLNAELLEVMQLVAEDLAETGREETAQRLAQIQEQAAAIAG